MGSSDQARRTRRPGREAGTQAREGERAGHFGADGNGEVAFPARDSGFPAGMTRETTALAFPARDSGFPAGMTLLPSSRPE